MRLLALLSAALLVGACFLPWILVESRGLTLTGVDALNFGKPGYFHFILTAFYLLFFLLNKNWAQKVALFFAAFNLAWAIRNFLLVAACNMGECPVKKAGIYILVPATVMMLVAVLLLRTGPAGPKTAQEV